MTSFLFTDLLPVDELDVFLLATSLFLAVLVFDAFTGFCIFFVATVLVDFDGFFEILGNVFFLSLLLELFLFGALLEPLVDFFSLYLLVFYYIRKPCPALIIINRGANTSATTDISLIRMLIEVPAVSLKGSPTVSPTTDAL